MIISKQSGLGRGLGALIPQKPIPVSDGTDASSVSAGGAPRLSQKAVLSGPPAKPRTLNTSLGVSLEMNHASREVPITSLEKNPRQPRRTFDHALMDELIASVKAHGILQPLLVTKKTEGKYQLIAGERRLRAATLAGLLTVPIVIRSANEQQQLELALIENIQRQDLNPLEEARAYEDLNRSFGLTQEDISKKMGKSRSQVANILRLLQLPAVMQEALMEGRLSASNARTLLALESETDRMHLFEAMLANRYTVRQAEQEVEAKKARPRLIVDPNVRKAEEQIRGFLQCKVKIHRAEKGDGEIRLRFYSDEELSAILEKLREG